mmetsp:Transcript_11203/g.26922  ORF Transcript_11203/g.26922 Transcript_11203/m.26922 type:complete len:179 (+) Transcript_11203:109-645(+)
MNIMSSALRSRSLVHFRSSLGSLPRCLVCRQEQQQKISIFLGKPAIQRPSPTKTLSNGVFTQLRMFQSESEYHSIADETLEDIQDAVEMALEDKGVAEFDVTYASGVLTMVLPPHGTYVLNKQTPNRQIWWSSPKTGPRRYEYEGGEWVFTRDESQSTTLVQGLKEEIHEIYGIDLDI